MTAFARWLALAMTVTWVSACADDAGTTASDATVDDAATNDLGASNDLARDAAPEAAVVDHPDAGTPVDDVGTRDAGVDVPHDGPGVYLAGYFIPVDPNAVPPPGSECAGDGGVPTGDPTIAPPRPIRPLSVSRVTSQRPTFQWALPDGTTGAHVEVCADRCCTRVLQRFDADGTSTRPATALPPGVVFWRMFGRRGTVVGSRASYTWEFGVRHRDAPNDTSWGTLRDFNGDGYDDLVVVATQDETYRTSDVLLIQGSASDSRTAIRTGITTPILPQSGSAGDFNGDGVADLLWSNSLADVEAGGISWIQITLGGSSGFHSVDRVYTNTIGGCADPFTSTATDWNGDGYSDVVASVTLWCNIFRPPTAEFLFIYYGSSRGIATTPQAVVRVDDLFLHPMTYANNALGDIDLDGYGDVYLISRFSGSGTTETYAEHLVAYGAPFGSPRYERVMGPLTDENASVNPLGDVDGDGHGDWSLWMADSHALDIYRYSRGLVAPSETLTEPTADANGSHFGADTSAGDLNGDGLSDVIVASNDSLVLDNGMAPTNYGTVYVYPGRPNGLSTSPSVVLSSPVAGDGGVTRDHSGYRAMSPGDLNGDGLDDLAMGQDGPDAATLGVQTCFSYGHLGQLPARTGNCTAWMPSFSYIKLF